jgi:hypothetical protein
VGSLFPAQEEASEGSSSREDEDTKANGLGELKAFLKQINLRESWPHLRRYLEGNSWFATKESRSVVGFARIITKSDLELAIGNGQAANILFQEL